MTSSSDLNTAIPLRCPFHALAIVQVGFAGARSFVHLHVSEFLKWGFVVVFVCFTHSTVPFVRAPNLNLITKKRVLDAGSIGTPVSVVPRSRHVSSLCFLCFFSRSVCSQSCVCTLPWSRSGYSAVGTAGGGRRVRWVRCGWGRYMFSLSGTGRSLSPPFYTHELS